MSEKSCESCAFSHNIGDGYDTQCRFNPPVVIFITAHGDWGSFWPIVQPNDWCGKFKESETND